MLETITLHFTDSPPLTLPADGITVFVGPNNSGKSLVLREIELAMSVYPFPEGLLVLKDYEVIWQPRDVIDDFIEKSKGTDDPNRPLNQRSISRINPNGGVEENNIDLASLYQVVEYRHDKHWYTTQFLKYGVIRLDGRSRFNLTNDQTAGDLLKPAQNLLGKLFRDDDARDLARRYVRDAFGTNVVIDPTHLGNLRFRLSNDKVPTDEQSLNNDARAFHKRAVHIKDASDGIQAYVGIIAAVVSGQFHTTLIDEPEAFLHPPCGVAAHP